MSIFDDFKGALKSLVSKKTDNVVAEAKTKMEEEAPKIIEEKVEEVKEAVAEAQVSTDAAIDTAVDNVSAAVEEATAKVDEVVHTENH